MHINDSMEHKFISNFRVKNGQKSARILSKSRSDFRSKIGNENYAI